MMPDKNVIFMLDAHQAYIYHPGDECKKYAAENALLFQAISGTYIPLLNMLASLENDKIRFKLAVAFSAPLCTLLSDPVVQKQYIDWLDRRIELGHNELERCRKLPELTVNVKFCLEKIKQDRFDFTERYEQNLLKYFTLYARKGYLELLATTGTYIFLPHYADIPEILNAQVETGLYAHKHFFGMPADGFWLPHMGYTVGIEKVLHAYGVNYTVLDSQSILFSETEPVNGLFAPVRCTNSLTVFGRDSDNQTRGENQFIQNSIYRDQGRDIGFELPAEQLSCFYDKGSERQPTGYRYWSNGETESRLPAENRSRTEDLYNPEAALKQAEADAEEFLEHKRSRLEAAAALVDVPHVSLVCSYDANLFGQTWYEGLYWLEQVIRKAADSGIRIVGFSDLLQNDYTLQKIQPYPSAAYGTGYGEDLLDSTNGWMMRYVRKASLRMVELAGFFPDDTGLKARLLNLGARELMIAQSSEWAKMIHEGWNPEYAAARFRESILAFTRVFDSLGSNTVSTEWLTSLEHAHPIFPWINYRIFSRKK